MIARSSVIATTSRSTVRRRTGLSRDSGPVAQATGVPEPQTRGTGRIGKTPTTIGAIGSNDSS
jgi:hypothetical protein